MAEPFKDLLNAGAIERLAGHVHRADAAFPRRDFLADVTPGLAPLSLMERVRHVAAGLARHLPGDFERSAATLVAALGPEAPEEGFEAEHADGVRGMPVLALTRFIADQGLDHFEPAMAALHAMTRRLTAEFDVRPFLERHPAATWARLHAWATDPSAHVRRLCSEGTRARLPWGKRVAALLADPEPGLALVRRLRDDPTQYVRRSVANHLNDVSKDHPDRVLAVARDWLTDASAERAWIVRHALRSRLKAADPAALALFDYPALAVDVRTFAVAPRVAFTGRLPYTLELVAAATGPALIDEVVHYVKARGPRSPKVFRVADRVMVAGEPVRYERHLDFKPITTRRHYPGEHRLEIRVNGRVVAGADFTLEAP